VALWHLGWGGKAPTRTWEAYFLHRNRLITELIHSSRRRPTAVVVHSFLGDVKPLLSLQYSAVRLRALAVADAFQAAEALPAWLRTRPAEVRAIWGTYPDAVLVDAAPQPATTLAPVVPRGLMRAAVKLAYAVARHLLIAPTAASDARPDLAVRWAELGWWTFARNDSALVETPAGNGQAWFRRSRAETRRALRRSLGLHLRLWWRWPRLSATLRAAAADLSSVEAWRKAFAE
jgi:galactofuranosylgalactofuranosylrhamnosyl-N-acetylglucosaminyl-diphospho-decaprenol beta-1,5/1,6-galactofuranosyltransferase